MLWGLGQLSQHGGIRQFDARIVFTCQRRKQYFRKESQVYRQAGVQQLCPLGVPEGLWSDKAGKRGRHLVVKGLV